MQNLNVANGNLADAVKKLKESHPEYFDNFVGRVFLINDNPNFWERRIVSPTKLTSKLKNPNVLGFHILAEIKNKQIQDLDSLKSWYSRTLAVIQTKNIDDSLATTVINQLENWGMLRNEEGTYKITKLGLVPATMYLWPEDVHHWKQGFSAIEDNNLWDNDVALSYVLGTTPSTQLDYVPRNEEADVDQYLSAVRKYLPKAYVRSVMAKDLYELLSRGKDHPRIRGVQYDSERTSAALERLQYIYRWGHEGVLDTIGLRIKYGISAEIVPLCTLPQIGAARARKMYNAGIKSLAQVKANPSKVAKLVGQGIAMQIARSFDDDDEYVNS